MLNLKMTKFIEKANKRHNFRYNYSKVEYINSATKVCIICPEHGEFWQTPAAHVSGAECPKCANKKRGLRTITTENLIERFRAVHGDRYDYSNVNYVNVDTKVVIICPEHGEFEQVPFAHLSGQGCPVCGGRKKSNTDEFIEKANKVHNNYYDYSLVEYVKTKDKVRIICPEHGEFEQTPQKHLQGQGCPICGLERGSKLRTKDFYTFVNEANKVHNNEYEYDESSYVNMHSKVRIKCKKHGWFEQYAYDHINGHGCPTCGSLNSFGEKELYEYVCSLVGSDNVIHNDRSVLSGREIDIFVPSMNIGFEYDGCLWHSEKFHKDKNYHLMKTEECKKRGIRLIHIFEDEYLNSKEIVQSKIRHLLGVNSNERIYGRKCTVSEIGSDEAKQFLNNNHIQGYEKAKVHIGCFQNGNLVGVMSFKNETGDNWNLARFATDINYNCVGVGGKLFNWFVNNYNPSKVKTFADRRWTVGDDNFYTKIGFAEAEILAPDYKYITYNDINRKHKFNFRKQLLHKRYGLSLDMTEKEMCDQLGFYRIWDCGLIRYEWTKKITATN